MNNRKNIFFTGATGFLGGYAIIHLLQHTSHQLYCLVRPGRNTSGEQRLRAKLEKMEGFDEEAYNTRLVVIEGDITEEGLGIVEPFPYHIDECWHSAAVLFFEHYLEKETMHVNYGGTLNVLKFVKEQQIPLLNFVSTAYVSGEANGLIKEAVSEHVHNPHNPYEKSKRFCEAAVLDAHREWGLQFRILRPSIIVGDSKNFVVDSNSGLYAYLSILLKLKDKIEAKMPEYFKFNPLRVLIKENATVNLICVDHVAALMAAVCEKPETINDVFHLTNPNPTPLEEYIDVIGKVTGINAFTVADESVLNTVDHLLLSEEEVFNSYLKTVQHFECNKAYDISGIDRNLPRLSYQDEMNITQNAKDKYDADERVQAKRLRSVVHRLSASQLLLDGEEDLTYYTGGNGPVMVILNAYGQSLAFWDWAVESLYEHYRIIIWPMRGTSSQKGGVAQVFPVQSHVNDIKQILDKEGVKECYIVAWCTGPKIALRFQEQHPAYVKSMVFLSGCFKGLPQFDMYHTNYERDMQAICSRVDTHPHIAGIVIEALKNVLVKENKTIAFAELKDEDGKRDLVDDILSLVSEDIKPMVVEPFLMPSSVLNYARQLLLLWNEDVTSQLEKLNIPVLMITGTADNIASPEISQAAAKLSDNATCAVIEGGSHYLQFDNIQLVVPMIRDFISSTGKYQFKHGLVTICD
ncbi:alpha/beta fold hydrolase [Chitinophaga sp. HK235]|uniref:alpha/beta fold hydrolase n=1 Tax=Chitinophaga sp. HK235 TaxID=2952571 RepID=UPI001BA4A54B|nr:alpha/beta fold hydrolase [Chitinophaga sp. HK235]